VLSTYPRHTHIHTHPFSGPLSRTTRVSRYQKGKTNLDFTEARVSEWQWHQLGRMQVRTSPQTDNHASTPALSFFTGQMPFLPPNQQRQSTEGTATQWWINCGPSSVELCRQCLRRSTFDRQAWPVYHTERPRLCTARCARDSASRGSVCDS